LFKIQFKKSKDCFSVQAGSQHVLPKSVLVILSVGIAVLEMFIYYQN